MTALKNRIDFTAVTVVKNANPNGDPLNRGLPRVDETGHGFITDVAYKRKIRNALQDLGAHIYVQAKERTDDNYPDLLSRLKGDPDINKIFQEKDHTKQDYKERMVRAICAKFFDVRAFGAVIALKAGSGNKSANDSIGIRGPVTIQMGTSLGTIYPNDVQITKSVISDIKMKGHQDTMGHKPIVNFGVYVTNGSILPNLAEQTGFSQEDAQLFQKALLNMFVNDASAARPDGSMNLIKLVWTEHQSANGRYPKYEIDDTVHVVYPQGARQVSEVSVQVDPLPGFEKETDDAAVLQVVKERMDD
ncbi:type I-C CRISPR-associated protein Cas7/Csd2 [Schleiferilactobacillus perolens]|uniref:type I-C CRISPR-associated protein Cas7/Csd2 n=1 Tax=Schleiferilactobacillus perolens TaxID=100468 RepID=UPI002355D410|nr:type I-C CRISPR-associated protein Cas7/Csd2 [Schleiferilactobacillus perolens]MCI2170023.1 type I-C CRISPR-associated protein Cas7/Csd2 [Schleiferilactobacillus perolens]